MEQISESRNRLTYIDGHLIYDKGGDTWSRTTVLLGPADPKNHEQ